MLRIVAENPSAFQDGNVNGLMAGYVLQLPDETDDPDWFGECVG